MPAVLDFSEIIPGRLWVGGYVSENDVSQLRRIGITSVFSLQTDEDLHHYGISLLGLSRSYMDAGIEFHRLPTEDFNREALACNLAEAVRQVEALLSHPGARLYLHCTAGVTRSATAAAGFLIRSRGFPAREACAYLISRRDCSPALDTLEHYQIMLKSENLP
jgi:protein-tyrosine phosphatase